MLIIFSFSSESDKDKFELIYYKYINLMLHKAYSILHDHMLAEDAVSEAMIRVYKNLDKIGEPSSSTCIAFLITIVKNTALTILEKEKGKANDTLEETQADDFNLESHIIAEITADEIYRNVDCLNEEMKGVFLLKYAYDLSHKEIGRLLGITENNVTVQLHRARKKLAKLLIKRGHSHEHGIK